jgi:branched-chain amino acid transport system permease protein
MSELAAQARSLRPSWPGSMFKGLWPFVAGIALAVLVQLVIKPMLDPYPAKLLLDIGINIVLAVSLTMVNGFTGQFSMGHAGFMAVGGYAAGIVTYYVSMLLWGSADASGGMLSGILAIEGLPVLTKGDLLFLFSLLVGGVVAGVLGIVVGLPSLRLRGDYLAIVTLGFGEIVRVLIQQTQPVLGSPEEVRAVPVWKLPAHVGGSLGFSGIPTYTSLFWVYLAVAVTLIVAFRLKTGTYGRAFLAIREDEIAAEAMGVRTTRYKVSAFVIAAFFAGIAGGLFAHTLGIGLSAEAAGFMKSFDVIIMVVLGGMGSISGAVAAAVFVTLLPEWLRGVAEYRMVIYALALILMMIFRPKGLFGVREVWERAAWSWLPWAGKGPRR